MSDWQILGIDKTDDLKRVKKAYAEKTKIYHPETHPNEFLELHNAYKRIVASIRKNADYQQQTEYQQDYINPVILNDKKKVQPTRDTNQDEDFIKYVNNESKKYENKYTDKRDLKQVAKVEYILNNDAKNTEVLKQFQWLIYNEFFESGWRKFFINNEFFERQYEPDFIKGMKEILLSRFLEMQKEKRNSFPISLLAYINIVYGDIFSSDNQTRIEEKIYREDLLQEILDIPFTNIDKQYAYEKIEQSETLLREKYTFLLYRRILNELNTDGTNIEKIKEILLEGFCKKDISDVFFDLLLQLCESDIINKQVFKIALAQICEMQWDSEMADEIEILKLSLGDLPKNYVQNDIEKTMMNNEKKIINDNKNYTTKQSINNIENKKTILMKLLRYKIPNEYQNRSDIYVCHYCTWKLGWIVVTLFVVGLIMCPLIALGMLESDSVHMSEELNFVLAIGCIIAIIYGIGQKCVSYMKNWTIILLADGIWYRNTKGEVYRCNDDEIEWYICTEGPKHYYITLKTKHKKIYINSHGADYRKVKQYIQQKYKSL